jgi:hypothetical protein
MDNTEMFEYIGFCGCIVFVLVVILAISFDTVEPIEWGLKHNMVTK